MRFKKMNSDFLQLNLYEAVHGIVSENVSMEIPG